MAQPSKGLRHVWVSRAQGAAPACQPTLRLLLQPPHAFKRRHGVTPWQFYRRQHWPILAALVDDEDLEKFHSLSELQAELEAVRRNALAYCVDCHNPLVATSNGWQYCPYERAGQHAKLIAALDVAPPHGSATQRGPRRAPVPLLCCWPKKRQFAPLSTG